MRRGLMKKARERGRGRRRRKDGNGGRKVEGG
jgi:hypothetical protein